MTTSGLPASWDEPYRTPTLTGHLNTHRTQPQKGRRSVTNTSPLFMTRRRSKGTKLHRAFMKLRDTIMETRAQLWLDQEAQTSSTSTTIITIITIIYNKCSDTCQHGPFGYIGQCQYLPRDYWVRNQPRQETPPARRIQRLWAIADFKFLDSEPLPRILFVKLSREGGTTWTYCMSSRYGWPRRDTLYIVSSTPVFGAQAQERDSDGANRRIACPVPSSRRSDNQIMDHYETV